MTVTAAAIAARSLRVRHCVLQQPHRRALASSSGSNNSGSDAATPSEEATAVAMNEAGQGEAARTDGAQVPAVKRPSDVAEVTPSAVESIDNILIRAHRREVVERVGPQAERYLPTPDPTAFLLPDSRLEPSERRWQKIFVALPWMVFACMLSAPLLLIHTGLPVLQKRTEESRRAAEARNAQLALGARVPEFTVVSFSQMPDVLERPFPTLLLLFDPATFASSLFLPFLRDLEKALRAAGLAVTVAALDLSSTPGPPDSFLWEYPRALTPHIQLVVPRAQDGEAGVVDYHGRWTAVELAEAARGLAGPYSPDVPVEELLRLDMGLEEFREALFELLFIDDMAQPSTATSVLRAPWWRRLLRVGRSTSAVETVPLSFEERRAEAVREAMQTVDLSAGLEMAITSCRDASGRLRAEA